MVLAICKWCGQEYKKHHNRQVYCTDSCRKEGTRELTRKRRRRYYYKYKKIIKEERGYNVGESHLGQHRLINFTTELEQIELEMKRYNL